MRTLCRFGTIVIAVFAATTSAAGQRVTEAPAEDAVLKRFDAAIGNYLRTHRFPEPVDLETLCLPDATLYAGPRFEEPPVPREGDVFTPEVVGLLRTRLATLNVPTNAGRTRDPVVAVGYRLPAGRGAIVPGAVAAILPPLPDDLGYRLVGADLVLVDLRTTVVVDLLRAWRGPSSAL